MNARRQNRESSKARLQINGRNEFGFSVTSNCGAVVCDCFSVERSLFCSTEKKTVQERGGKKYTLHRERTPQAKGENKSRRSWGLGKHAIVLLSRQKYFCVFSYFFLCVTFSHSWSATSSWCRGCNIAGKGISPRLPGAYFRFHFNATRATSLS